MDLAKTMKTIDKLHAALMKYKPKSLNRNEKQIIATQLHAMFHGCCIIQEILLEHMPLKKEMEKVEQMKLL